MHCRERDQGITIDNYSNFFKQNKRKYIFIDAPNKEFIKNMITELHLQISILIVDVNEGLREQTKNMPTTQIIRLEQSSILVKQDGQNKYTKKIIMRESDLKIPKKISVEVESFIPVTAKFGDNIVNKSNNTNWFVGQTFCEVLDNYKIRNNEKKLPLRFPVQDIYKQKDKRIIVGKLNWKN